MKTLTLLLALSLLAWGCGKSDSGSDHGHNHGDHGHDHAHGDHGHGHDHDHDPGLIEVGEHVAHIDFAHDATAGSVTLTVTGPDAKTALAADSAPKLNLTGDNPLQIETTAKEGATGVYVATNDALKAEPEGRIAISIGGQSYQPTIKHDHDGHDHK